MKKCPSCAEEIKDEAIVCKHCHTDLNKTAEKSKVEVVAKEGFFLKFMNCYCLGAVIIAVIVVVFIIIAIVLGLQSTPK